jgi:hypothetical protein
MRVARNVFQDFGNETIGSVVGQRVAACPPPGATQPERNTETIVFLDGELLALPVGWNQLRPAFVALKVELSPVSTRREPPARRGILTTVAPSGSLGLVRLRQIGGVMAASFPSTGIYLKKSLSQDTRTRSGIAPG